MADPHNEHPGRVLRFKRDCARCGGDALPGPRFGFLRSADGLALCWECFCRVSGLTSPALRTESRAPQPPPPNPPNPHEARECAWCAGLVLLDSAGEDYPRDEDGDVACAQGRGCAS